MAFATSSSNKFNQHDSEDAEEPLVEQWLAGEKSEN